MKSPIVKSLVVALAAFCLLCSWSSPTSPQEEYVRKYAPVAVREMYRSGVPASITLAQGLLESRYGQSELATEGNNHFGIKCHNWKGKTMKHDDDRRGECFRVYDDAEASFRDHSDFLRYSDRYKFLFEYKTTDYKSWAYGLKKAGYATDPKYPEKLIKNIEDYRLYNYDKMSVAQADKSFGVQGEERTVSRRRKKDEEKAEKVRSKEERKSRKRVRSAAAGGEAEKLDVIPASPLSIEEPKKLEEKDAPQVRESHTFSLSRQMYSKNGVPFIYSSAGETMESIAKANNLFLRELLKYNDLTVAQELLPGTVVYLQPKKNRSAKGLDKYIVAEDGEDLRDIAQRFGVKLSALKKMNGFIGSETLKEGDTVLLR